jgi:plastocyanin
MGLRSPWRFGFDSDTGDLYVGDRGQSQYEEINFQLADSPGGENYGWSVMEGVACTNGLPCDKTGKVTPVVRYLHGGSCVAVVGGTVYRGLRYPDLVGLYLYADNCLGVIVASARNDQGLWVSAQVAQQRGIGIQSIGEDADGELYVVGSDGGRVLHLASGAVVSPTPGTLTPGTPSTTRPPSPTATPSRTATPSGRTLDVVARDFSFSPTTLRAALDEVLIIRLANQGQGTHDIEFELDDSRVESSDRVTAGQSTEISFYAPAVAGRYNYYCTVGDHRARGMSGVLEVGQQGPCPNGCTYLPRLLK